MPLPPEQMDDNEYTKKIAIIKLKHKEIHRMIQKQKWRKQNPHPFRLIKKNVNQHSGREWIEEMEDKTK